jgi:hypothetical protein
VVVPVPMHWWRRSLRGASVADDLAGGVAALIGLPVSRALVRRRATRMQNELPVEERPRNVDGAFHALFPSWQTFWANPPGAEEPEVAEPAPVGEFLKRMRAGAPDPRIRVR